MILLGRYVHGKRPYAVDLRSFVVDHRPPAPWIDQNGETHVSTEYWRLSITAIWFRGKVATPEACIGTLEWSVRKDPLRHDVVPGMEQDCLEEDALVAVQAHSDGRYGGSCVAKLRSDGTLWTADDVRPAAALTLESRLAPVLQYFPSVPGGFIGWWTFVDKR